MKQCIALAFAAHLFACTSLFSQSFDTTDIISENDLRALLEVLASDSMLGRATGTTQNLAAAHFIAAEFKAAGLKHAQGDTGYLVPFEAYSTQTNQIHASQNVVAVLPGRSLKNEIVILCAHYDHIGTESMSRWFSSTLYRRWDEQRDDTIYNGANDNATGVAALISLAKYYAKLANNERTILFVAFSGEELGLLGSEEFVKTIDRDSIIRVVNLEMLARPAKSSKRLPFVIGWGDKKYAAELNSNLHLVNPQAPSRYFRRDPFYSADLEERSDHYSFFQKRVPAFTIMNTSPEDYYYHTPGDEIKTLDFKAFTSVVRMIALACVPYANPIAAASRIALP